MSSDSGIRSAGRFDAWLAAMREVLKGRQSADVPCDGCVGCCVSSYAIALRPEDKTALAAVPAQHLRLPSDGGMAFMGYREDGTCPMLEAGGCMIYQDRPQTCRDYDCRIYAATGLMPDGERPVIRDRVSQWRFDLPDAVAEKQLAAVRRAAQFIAANAAGFPPGMKARSAAAVAVLAVKVWPLFTHEKGDGSEEPSPVEMTWRVLEAARAFDAD